MIAQLRGVVLEREEKALIVDVQGVGYRVFVTSAFLEKANVGTECTVLIYDHITEGDHVLFGFEKKADREYFELLLRVPSIGPKTALGILDAAPAAVLSQAIHTNDMALLTSLSGIGKRTAERIVVELKGKMAELGDSVTNIPSRGVYQEVTDALVAIGFTPVQAREAVQKLPKDIATVEEGVKAALKQPA